ncbi:MAG: hypothetical protein RL660_1028 [Bacteroidota bacterium]|jgi:activator of HSP90 ATPase
MPNFKKYFDIPAPADEVYRALTNALALQLWTGGPVIFEASPGTEFSLFDDGICGKNLEFIEDKLIRQEWYFGEDWHDCIVTIKTHVKSPTSCSLEIQQSNIPTEAFEDIVAGWHEVYVPALINFFDGD